MTHPLDDKLVGNLAGDIVAQASIDQRQHYLERRNTARAGESKAIDHEEVLDKLYLGKLTFHPSGDRSRGTPDGGGRGDGPPVHRRARHQQGAWRLPEPGFVDCARRLGRFAGGQDARTVHAAELTAVFARWGGSRDN